MIYENMRQHDKVQQSDDEEKFLFIISNNSTNSPIQWNSFKAAFRNMSREQKQQKNQLFWHIWQKYLSKTEKTIKGFFYDNKSRIEY